MNALTSPRARSLAVVLALVALIGLALPGCGGGRKGRIMSGDEDDVVGDRSAGAATYDRLINEVVQKLLANYPASTTGLGKLKIAFAGLENESGEALGSWHSQIETLITTSVNRSQRFRTISTRYVTAGLKQLNIRVDDLFIKENQRRYAAVMEEQGQPLDCLLFAKINSAPTQSGDTSQVNYLLTLELVDVTTGDPIQESALLRKEYTR